MQVSVTSNEGLGRSMTVELPAARIETEIQQRLKTMTGRVKVDGFRPGKVPLSIVQKRYGTQVREEVESELLRSSFYEAIQQEKLRPAGTPKIEADASKGDQFTYTATFEVYPEVKVEIPADMVVETPTVEIGDADLDGMIDKLRKQRVVWVSVDRAAEMDDQLVLDFIGRIDGEAFEGGEAKDHPLVLGSKRFIGGFEEQLVGLKAGESKDVDVTFPDDYQGETLAGKAAVFAVTVKSVNASTLPDVNDEAFLSALGISEGGVDTLRSNVRQSMERELKQKIAEVVKAEALDKLLKANPFELPVALVDDEIRKMASQASQEMGMQGELPITDEIRNALGERASWRVALGLMLGELIREKDFKADADKVRAQIEELAQSYEDPQSVVSWYHQDKSRLAGVEALVLENQVVEWLLSEIKTKPVTKSFEEIMQAQPA